MKTSKTDNHEELERAKRNLDRMVRVMTKTHEIGKLCNEFVGGEQWQEGDIKSREATSRPMITINKLDNYVNTVVNKNSQERSRIKAIPFEGADADTAKVVNGLIKHIQYSDKSDAGEAYSKAFFDMVVSGFGYWRVDTEYCNDLSVTEQEIVINRIDDPFSVFLDPNDKFAVVVNFLPKEEFEDEYGEEYTPDDWGIAGLSGDDPDDVMVVEYWEKTKVDVEIHSIELPDIIAKIESEEIDDAIEQAINTNQKKQPRVITVTNEELEDIKVKDFTVLASRTSKESKVTQYIFAGKDLLKKVDWAGKYIPIVGCYGRKFKMRDETFFYKPLVYNALDPQKYYNYLKSQDAELMMMAPKSPWMGVAGQFKGHEDEFARANTDHVPYLEYEAKSVYGQLAPPPQRQPPPQPNQAFYANMMQANDEIKSTIGMYDASLGATSNETSGRAILARGRQGDVATHHFTVASNVALRQTGLIIIDLRPHIYDTARTIRILGDDMTEEVVKINQQYTNEKGESVNYDMKAGKYDIKIDTGSNSITRRLDAAENLLEFAKFVPAAGVLGSDFIARSMDFEDSEELALRMKASQDPALLARVEQLKKSKDGQPVPTPEQMQMQKMGQQLQGMQQQMMQQQDVLKKAAQENQSLKKKITDDKLMVEKVKAEAGIREEQIRAQSGIAEEQIKANAGIQETKIEAAADVKVALIESSLENNSTRSAVAPHGGRQCNMAMNNNVGGR